MKPERVDFLVIGSGLAGLTFALRAAEHGKVVVLTKAEMQESNTNYAQGGIAAAVGEADSWELHEEDTVSAGAGVGDPEAIRFLVRHAPEAIQWLRDLGAQFDVSSDGDLALGREGGHSRNRIIHHRDRTGWEVERAMLRRVQEHRNISIFEHAFVTRLIGKGGRCVGAEARIEDLGFRWFSARATMLATGGCGRVYQHTTNPSVATGDGIALASALGAEIRDMEFQQFHPTTLYHPQMRSFLITEAVRGEGATLRNHLGSRFMYDYDPRLELAPRDVVARAIDSEMRRLGTWCVYLDLTHIAVERIKEHFPTIYERLASIGIQMEKDWIPVVPAQHYCCGGVVTNLNGQTSVPGLYAAGEVACTGVHGANRLASNSLLEAMVFSTAASNVAPNEPEVKGEGDGQPWKCVQEAESIHIRRALQKVMFENVGIVRRTKDLKKTIQVVEELIEQYDSLPEAPYSQHPLETRNLLVCGQHIVRAASERKENVGLHYNADLVTEAPPRTPVARRSAAKASPTRVSQAPARKPRRP